LNISTKTGLVGFFLALGALNIPTANAIVKTPVSITIESRLSRITETLRERENQLQEKPEVLKPGEQIAGAWGNGSGGFVNRGGGGGGNWRNSWADGGRFINSR
jgi:rSAM-associated Gly-rich repeat protein